MWASTVAAVVLVLTTQNVRVTLPPDEARHDIRQAAEHSSVVVTQEMGRRHAARFAPAGWGTAHRPGVRRGDCAAYWDRDAWHRVRAYAVPITWATFRAGHRWALVTVLAGHGLRVAVVCVHMVTHGLSHPIAYRNGTRRLAALLVRLRGRVGPVVVAGDWNARWGEARGRVGYPPRVLGPTFNAAPVRRIDWAVWSRPGVSILAPPRVIRHTYSDHNGVRFRLRVRQD